MKVENSAGAHIRLMLGTNDASQLQQLTRDLRNSKYVYAFSHHEKKASFLAELRNLLARESDWLPTVIVLNYRFAGRDCETILRLVQDAARRNAIECVVTHPPADLHTRAILNRLGARLFDSTEEFAQSELSLH